VSARSCRVVRRFKALLELDPSKLAEGLSAAEPAISKRVQDLAGDTSHQRQRQAIEDALNTLRVLKRSD
jgi:secreted protein with Ig-like and vWFA domain